MHRSLVIYFFTICRLSFAALQSQINAACLSVNMGVNGVWRRCYAKDNAVHRLHRGFVQKENEPAFMEKKMIT
jgi:hypothetical protein